MFNYDVNKKHAKNVIKLAKELFFSTQGLHKLNLNNLEYLKYAASLHNIGIYIDYYSHHKHSEYLILNSGLVGFNYRELFILSAVCGKHRNKSYKVNYAEYKNILQKDDIHLINILSLLLRITENLDRREEGKIRNLYKGKDKESCFIIELESDEDISLKISTAMKSAGDFEKLFGKKLILEIKEAPS